MRGILFAFLGGACITLQGVANARISEDIGTWQAATITQLTGFLMALLIYAFVRDGDLGGYRKVKPLYLAGGAFGAVIIYSEVTAIQHIGVTFTISALLIAQLLVTFLIDTFGWFGRPKSKMGAPQFIGLALMVGGVLVMKL
ncbi:DMT family transporter [Saccharibacillus brassicae]|uniref:DMT family transporter n=1 Tax=Saccharibacillus brassicae TaxID=2583377 RepID=A0A4Y6V5G6_SACBS|nr:DMT family transporter [Saccharibacillus brassicae]QDH23881.1 DMT family transporter [Saccharibacillus brassicae]